MSQEPPNATQLGGGDRPPAIDEFDGLWNVRPLATHNRGKGADKDQANRYSNLTGRAPVGLEEIQTISKFVETIEKQILPIRDELSRPVTGTSATTHHFGEDRTLIIAFHNHRQFTKANAVLFHKELANAHPLWRINLFASDSTLIPIVYSPGIVLPSHRQSREEEFWTHLHLYLQSEFEASVEEYFEVQEKIVEALLRKRAAGAFVGNKKALFPIAAFRHEFVNADKSQREFFVWVIADNLYPGPSHLPQGRPRLKSYRGYQSQFGILASGEMVKHRWGAVEVDRRFVWRAYLLCFDLNTFDGRFDFVDLELNHKIELKLDDPIEVWDRKTAMKLLDELK